MLPKILALYSRNNFPKINDGVYVIMLIRTNQQEYIG